MDRGAVNSHQETLSMQGKGWLHVALVSLQNVLWGPGPHTAAPHVGWGRQGSGLGAGDWEVA